MPGRRFPDSMACLLLLALASAAANVHCAEEDTCLVLVGETGGSHTNAYCYHTFSSQRITIAKGDVLEYEIFQPVSNPSSTAGLDIEFSTGKPLRETACQDKTGKPCHPNRQLQESLGRWLSREIALAPLVGRSAQKWNVAFEGEPKGVYVLCVDNVAIAHADGTRTVVYANGPPTVNRPGLCSGYDANVVLTSIPRANATNEGLARWLAQERPDGTSRPAPAASPDVEPESTLPRRKVRLNRVVNPQPVPDLKRVEEARALVRDFFKSEYAAAADSRCEALISRLMKEAAHTNTDMDLKYALLDEALTAARQCERFDLALDATDALACAFELDGWEPKVEIFRKAVPDSVEKGRLFVACGLKQLATAIDEDRYEEAQTILGLTRDCASRLKDEQSLELLKNQAKDLAEYQALFARYQAATKVPEDQTDAAVRHLAIGTYLCFVKEDLETGLPHLAACSDPVLKALAAQELARPTASADRLALADAWFELAQKPGAGQALMQERAAAHYEAVLPQLENEAREKAAHRLALLHPGSTGDAGGAEPTRSGSNDGALLELSFDQATISRQNEHVLARDLSGNAHRVILVNCTTCPGVQGDAVLLDGKQSRIVVVDSGKLDVSGRDFTVSVWFRPDALPAREQMIFEKSAWPQPETFQISLFSPRTVRFNYPAISPGLNHEISLTAGTWYHYACVVQAGKTLTFYGNGKVVASAPMVKPIGPGSSPIHLGYRRSGSCFFQGAIDEFLLIPRALTADGIAVLAKRSQSPPSATPPRP